MLAVGTALQDKTWTLCLARRNRRLCHVGLWLWLLLAFSELFKASEQWDLLSLLHCGDRLTLGLQQVQRFARFAYIAKKEMKQRDICLYLRLR